MMDLSDFENVSGKNSFWFFLISYSGSDKFLLAWDADNFDLQIILYSEGSHLTFLRSCKRKEILSNDSCT